MPEILLHQWEISPFCGKIRAILRHKGLSFQVRNYNGLLARKAAALTPAGTLPVLDYDGQRVAESSAIAAFLEQRHPEPALLPADPEARARVRVWEDWADESLYWLEIYSRFSDPEATRKAATMLCEGRPTFERTLLLPLLSQVYRRKLKTQGLGRLAREDVEAKLFGHLDDLETLLSKSPWLVGDTASLADIAAAAQLREIIRTSPLRPRIEQRKAVVDWIERALPTD
ncbi:MAG: glutathione S-transferase family protein [Myxococcota bacterium]